MTEIIDLSLIKNESKIDFFLALTQGNPLIQKINKLPEVVIWSPYQKRQWKHNTIYYFQLDNKFTRKLLNFQCKKVKIKGKLTLLDHSFNLCFLFVDELNNTVKCRSKYHKILLSKFCFQLNSNLQHYRLKVNLTTGEISFHFQLAVESLYFVDVEQIVQFALNCYQQQIEGHFYTLQLLQFASPFRNMYVININQTLQLIKTIICHKNKELQKKQLSVQNFNKKNNNSKNQAQKEIQNESTQYSMENLSQKSQNQDQFFFNEESIKNIIKQLRIFLIQSDHLSIQTGKQFDIKSKFSLQVKRLYQKDKIFNINLIRKSKMNNILNIQIKKNKLIQDLIQKKNNQSNVGNCMTFQNKIINLEQKGTNKIIRIEVAQYCPDVAFQQYYICQNLTKFQSLRFVNQYIKLSNYPLIQNGFVLSYHVPSKITLKSFLQINKINLSLISKSAIAYHLVVIVYTIQQKNKIANYFPWISIDNIEVSSNYSLNLKRLVKISPRTIPPLEELLQILHYIFFQKTIQYQESTQLGFPFSSDQVFNLFLGPTSYINLIKLYIFKFLSFWKIQSQKLNAIKEQTYQRNDQIEVKKKIQELNIKFGLICEDFMIIFGYFSQFLGKESNFQSKEQSQNSHINQKQV